MTPDSTVFEEPEERADSWVDIRMTEPDKGEWDVDVIVVDGAVEYVDLRIKPELLASFIDCLVEDVPENRARDVLSTVAERHGIEDVSTEGADAPGGDTTGEPDRDATAESDIPSSVTQSAEEN
jgi:hypothetical protein